MWVRVATWVEIDETRFDEDGALDPTLSRDLQFSLVGTPGIDKVDGMALFAEAEDNVAPWNGGTHAR
jgi:hypothetical protein